MSTESVSDAGQPSPARSFTALSPDDLITLNEEIAGMARAGLPLDQGLKTLAREMRRGRLRRATAEIAEDLRAGRTLPEALERQQGRVPAYYGSLLAAGIRAGRLGTVLATLTNYARTIADMRAIIAGALVYPAVIVLITYFMLGFFIYLLLPTFREIYVDFGLPLPNMTLLALYVAKMPLEVYVGLPIALVVGLYVLRLLLAGTGSVWVRTVYFLPVVGPMIQSSRLAAFVELLAILVDHQVPLPEAIALAGSACSDPRLEHDTHAVKRHLEQGQSLGAALRAQPGIPQLVAWMTGLGERRGALPGALRQIAQVYQRQVELRAGLLRNLLPPVIIIICGLVVGGFFLIALLLPLISLLNHLGQ